eukprot:Phypoly_transcript_05619.p1 GENE.Phypoly_transcript_05619~~Phypoly_transcript_05619.p1  ORF type:complete len:448 (+),score=41.22 Phypoly_transcript_05619:9-1352(+)
MVVLTVIFLVISIALLAAYKRVHDSRSNMPSPGLLWFLKRNRHMPQDFLQFVEQKRAGLVHGFFTNRVITKPPFFGLKSTAVITHPDIAQIILRDEETFIKDATTFGEAGQLLRESLIASNGPQFKTFKDILAPAFHYNLIKSLAPLFASKSEATIDHWVAKGGKNLNIHEDLGCFTLDTLGIAAFNIDFETLQGGSHQYLEPYRYIVDPDPYQKRVPEKILEVRQSLSEMTNNIAQSKQTGDKKNETKEIDFLDRLLSNSDKLTQEQIRDNIFLMFLAGHETTANALTWALYHLAKYPEMQETARNEVDTALNGAMPDAENVKSLTFVDMFIKESMRIKPSVGGLISRVATKDVQVGEYLIPKDTRIGLSMYVIHHLQEFWPDPEKFDPFRFSHERSEGRHPFSYLPFSLGRRMCIGNNFAILKQKIFLAQVLAISEKCDATLISV